MRKVIIITGANRGIGAACAHLFLKKKYHVALLGRNIEELTKISSDKSNAIAIACDVTKDSQITQAFEKVVKKWGRLDLLFNNAGISLPEKRIEKMSTTQWRKLLDVNLTGSFVCAREAFKIMLKQVPQGGRIINNGSVAAHAPRFGTSAYSTSKHGITGLTKSIALDGRNVNIACSQIDIGNADTNMVKEINNNLKNKNLKLSSSLKAEPTIDVKYVAKSVLQIAELPLEANVMFMTLLATKMPFIGRG